MGALARLDSSTSPQVREYFTSQLCPVRWYFTERSGSVRRMTDQWGEDLFHYRYDGEGVGQATASSMWQGGATIPADRWRGEGQPWWQWMDDSWLTVEGGRLQSPQLGRALGGSPDELGRGEYNCRAARATSRRVGAMAEWWTG
jgi:hypothetical protein